MCRKECIDLQKQLRDRAVIAPLLNRDIHFPEMTNAVSSRTVPLDPNGLTEK